jgi:hypothetical protein
MILRIIVNRTLNRDNCCDRKIKPEILAFHSDIAGETADPVEFVVKKINKNANDDPSNSCDHYPFAGILIHT